MNTNVEFVRGFREEFLGAISLKNSWSKNEIELLFNECVIKVLEKIIMENEKNDKSKN